MSDKKCLIYLSDANLGFSTTTLNELALTSSKRNESLMVTGFICYARGRFLQYLEGEPKALEHIMSRIRLDKRHSIIYEHKMQPLEQRLFESWAMRLIKPSELDKFSFELQIEQNLLYIKNNIWFKKRCEENIWRYIEKMSSLKNYLEVYKT